MNRIVKFVVPVTILGVGVIISLILIKTRPEATKAVPDVRPPLVRIWEVKTQSIQLEVLSQGFVTPATESQLISEVNGKVVEVAPSFEDGAFFDEQELLLRIDDFSYRLAVTTAEAEVARAELRLAQEQAEATLAREEWHELGMGEADPLSMREPQMHDAKASLEAARARLERAERDLSLCEIRAPYAGRIQKGTVDLGQYVSVGMPLAKIYAIDAMEISVNIPDRELAFLDLSLAGGRTTCPVEFSTDFAGQDHRWLGEIVRTASSIDPQTRMITLFGRVAQPFRHGQAPLAPGLFVKARIKGRTHHEIAIIPREAVRNDSYVLVVDNQNKIYRRPVQVLQYTIHDALISEGLQNDDRVAISRIEVVTEGMLIEPLADES
ncbi:MAG: efflux RND transporter periplasmic adaptor subunit [Acidobacteria bacterium]|nr:efflux RND transporter periplasmic adaptor subunit [Acidobacteriota bacterium]